MESARRPLTYDDLLVASVPDRRVPELIEGELVYKASPRAGHALAQGELRGELHRFGRRDGGGWWLLTEPDVRFSDRTVVRPDLAGWRRESLPTLPEGPVDLRPDWICEVLSPSREAYDRQTKRALYAREGVPHYWLVSPEARTVEVFELRGDLWTLLGTWTGGSAVLAPFDGEIDVSVLFVPREGAPPRAHEAPPPSYG